MTDPNFERWFLSKYGTANNGREDWDFKEEIKRAYDAGVESLVEGRPSLLPIVVYDHQPAHPSFTACMAMCEQATRDQCRVVNVILGKLVVAFPGTDPHKLYDRHFVS